MSTSMPGLAEKREVGAVRKGAFYNGFAGLPASGTSVANPAKIS